MWYVCPINNSSFNLSQFQDSIRQHGERVKYYIGHKCSCALIQTGTSYGDPNRADPNCAACHGYGIVWVYSSEILGIVSGIEQQRELLQAGIVSPGDLVLSPDLTTVLSDMDKIQLTWPDGLPFEGELIKHDSAFPTDTSMYGIVSVPNDGCITVDPITGDITTYKPNIDFTWSGNQITWIGNTPTDQSFFSFKYNALIDWIVFVPPQPRRERGTNLGQKVVLRKKHMVFNGA